MVMSKLQMFRFRSSEFESKLKQANKSGT